MRKQLIIFVFMCQYGMVLGPCVNKQDVVAFTTSSKCPPHQFRSLPVPHRNRFPLPLYEILKYIVTPPHQLEELDCGRRAFKPPGDIDDKRRTTTMEGAVSALQDEWPWMADIRTPKTKCSGMLIAMQYVLTASSCIREHAAKDVVVTLGGIGRDKAATSKVHHQVFRVENFKHHEFLGTTNDWSHDIAIIKLEKPVNISGHHVYPICLPFKPPLSKTNFNTKFGYIIGFNEKDDKLHGVPTRVISNYECWHSSQGPSYYQICAGGAKYNHDSCWRDTGSALIASYFGRWYGLGVVNRHKSCIDTTESTVAARITTYLDWIKYYFL